MRLTDEKRALLSDHEAAKRLTEKGVLVPCPFCGGEAELIDYTLGFDVACKNYGCRGNSYSTYGDDDGDLYFGTVEESRLAWNTRAPILSESELKKLEKRHEKDSYSFRA